MFADPPQLLACIPAGATEVPGACGPDEPCAVTVVSPCREVCDETGCRDLDGITHAETMAVRLEPEATSCTQWRRTEDFGDAIGNYNF